MADRIAPVRDDLQREALLPLVSEDLKEAVWRLDVVLGLPPRLLINSRFPGLKQRLKEDPLLMGAILPLAVRDVLRVVCKDEDEGDWVVRWRKFVVEVAGEHCANTLFGDDDTDEDDVTELIEHVCSLLTDRRRYLSRALAYVGSDADA